MGRDRHTDQPISAEDLRLVEALYGESPDSEVEASDELEGLRELRSMFAELPEEEPPSAISAKLMSAAAEAVKARAPQKPGLWSRLLALFGPIAAHPALAAAASLMLVVTIGGVMIMSGRSKVSRPDTRAERPAAPAATEKTEEGRATDMEEELAPPAEPEPDVELPKAAVPEGKKTESATAVRVGGETRAGPSSDRFKKGRVDDRRKDKADNGTPGNVVQGGAGGTTAIDFDVGDEDGEPDDANKSPDPKPRPPDTAVALERQKSAKISAEVESLTSKARKAADRNDCRSVVKAVARIRSLDNDSYQKLLSSDSKIRGCVSPKVRKGKK